MTHSINVSRRDFVAQTVIGAAALCSGGLVFAAEPKPFSPSFTVFSKVYQELKLNYEQAADVTAESGLEGIDCPVREGGEIEPERAVDEMPRYAEALRKRKTNLLLLTTGITSVESPHAEDILRTAKKLGVRYYRFGQWMQKKTVALEKQADEIRAQLKGLAAMNKEIGICGTFQNHSPGGQAYWGGNLTDMHSLVKDFNPDEVGVAFDLGHAIVVHGDEWRPLFERLKGHVKSAYIKDVKRPRQFVPFGQGEFAKSGYFTMLKAMNYQAPFSIHIEFDWAGKGKPKTMEAMIKALAECRVALRKWVAEA